MTTVDYPENATWKITRDGHPDLGPFNERDLWLTVRRLGAEHGVDGDPSATITLYADEQNGAGWQQVHTCNLAEVARTHTNPHEPGSLNHRLWGVWDDPAWPTVLRMMASAAIHEGLAPASLSDDDIRAALIEKLDPRAQPND